MSIIQTIRDRGALISAVVIALALLGFIAMDATSSGGGLFGGGSNSTTVGSINGEKIEFNEFQFAVDQQAQALVNQGFPAGDISQQRAIEEVWNQRVSRAILEKEFDKAGIDVTTKETNNSILFGNNPPNEIRQWGTDPQTGVYDPTKAYQILNELKNSNDPVNKAQVAAFIDDQALNRKYEKYLSLLSKSTNAPKWLIEKQNEESGLVANVSFVRKPYSEIPDSTVVVTDKEIADYISKHKDVYQQEETRNIAYVSFSAKPSASDSAEVRNEIVALKSQFESVPNSEIANFVMANSMEANPYLDEYLSGKLIQVPEKDSIFRTPVGSVYGPYVDGNNYALAKVVGVKQVPDSVKVRHILVATNQRSDAEALALIDSAKALLAKGVPFNTVCSQISEDPGSKDNGGVYTAYWGQMVPEFNSFIFSNPVGSKDVVKTSYGYHYIEILSNIGSSAGYKIAYVFKRIFTGAETEQLASNSAAQLASESKNEKTFNEAFDKNWKPKGYNKGIAVNITPDAYNVMGIPGSARQLVKSVYSAKRGEVIEPIKVGDDYVVAIVTDVFKKGTQSVGMARASVEPLLRNRKKAEKIITEIGQITSLDAVAAKLSKTIESADSLRFSGFSSPALAGESKVIGAAFNPENRNKTVASAIPARQGVYVLRVDNVSSTPVVPANSDDARRFRNQQLQQSAPVGTAIEALRKAAKIKDNRSKFY